MHTVKNILPERLSVFLKNFMYILPERFSVFLKNFIYKEKHCHKMKVSKMLSKNLENLTSMIYDNFFFELC